MKTSAFQTKQNKSMRAKLIFEKISGTDKLLARQIKRKRGQKLLISEMK